MASCWFIYFLQLNLWFFLEANGIKMRYWPDLIFFRLSPVDVTACLECGLEVATGITEMDPTSEIILISSSSEDKSSFNSTSAFHQLLSASNNIHHVFFRSASPHEEQTGALGANTYLVPTNPHAMIRQHLSDIFLSILKNSINGPTIECTFLKTWSESPPEVRGTFVVESSVNSKLLVLLTTDVKNDLEIFELTSPSGQKHAFPKYDYASVYFQLDSQFKVWPFIFFTIWGCLWTKRSTSYYGVLASFKFLEQHAKQGYMPFKCAVSYQRALQESETETNWLAGRKEWEQCPPKEFQSASLLMRM